MEIKEEVIEAICKSFDMDEEWKRPQAADPLTKLYRHSSGTQICVCHYSTSSTYMIDGIEVDGKELKVSMDAYFARKVETAKRMQKFKEDEHLQRILKRFVQ